MQVGIFGVSRQVCDFGLAERYPGEEHLCFLNQSDPCKDCASFAYAWRR
jgi:hypothetical protein